ncbi:uncharacterized protein LOC143603077 [Bidens hawaiensis]|uniref:uncharacterized protein LOC143603077 n=1 Tax=Bidens hawaiensis TaxID=980011 RepID=UPI0040491886
MASYLAHFARQKGGGQNYPPQRLNYTLQGGILYRRSYLGPLLRCVDAQDANYLLREIQEGICGVRAGPRMVVAKIMNTGYYWPVMHGLFWKLVAIDYFTKWDEAKPVATINAASIKKYIWEFIICRFGLPMNLVSDNGTQFADQRIREWLKELNITQTFTSVAHPLGNGEVERANRSIVGGIKRWPEDYKSGWVD